MAKYDPSYLDDEEKGLLAPLSKVDRTKLRKPSAKEHVALRSAAQEFLKSEAKMNIRIATSELIQIKERAKKEGLRYQSLVKSVPHKYITGQLVEHK